MRPSTAERIDRGFRPDKKTNWRPADTFPLPPSTLRRLATDPGLRMRRLAPRDADLPVVSVERLVADPDNGVRHAVVGHLEPAAVRTPRPARGRQRVGGAGSGRSAHAARGRDGAAAHPRRRLTGRPSLAVASQLRQVGRCDGTPRHGRLRPSMRVPAGTPGTRSSCVACGSRNACRHDPGGVPRPGHLLPRGRTGLPARYRQRQLRQRHPTDTSSPQ